MRHSMFIAIGTLAVLLAGMFSIPALAASSGTLVTYSSAGIGDITFTVENVGMFTRNDSYLNFTVQSDPTVMYAGANSTYYVHVNINDGTTNYTWNKTIAAKNDRTVYSNVSLSDPGATFVYNASATIGVEINHVNGGDCQVENYTSAEIAIFNEPISGSVLNLIPVIMVVAIVSIMLPMLTKFGKQSK